MDQPAAAANDITHMKLDLYKAASRGQIHEEFNRCQQLQYLLTPNRNTVLHVYLATHDPHDVLGRSDYKFHRKAFFHHFAGTDPIDLLQLVYKFGSWLRFSVVVPKNKQNLKLTNCSFVEQILNRCPQLLLQPNAQGQTPLHIAAMYGHSKIVKLLIDYQRNASGGGDHENQAAAGSNELEMMRERARARAREMLRKRDLESNTALHVAAKYGHIGVVRELLVFEDSNFSYPVNGKQETPLYIAAERKGNLYYLSVLDELLRKFNSVAHGGPHGRTILHAAAMAGDAEATRKILEKEVRLTRKTDENGQTPLHYAAHLGYYSVVKVLLDKDKYAAYVADQVWGMTPLLMAARQGLGQTVAEIISRCPDCCEIVDKRGWNLLHYVAFRLSSPPELKYFLEDDSETPPYASIRDLRDEDDNHGITPRHVFAALRSGLTIEPMSLDNNLPTKKMEQIVKLLNEIEKDEVANVPVYPIRSFIWSPTTHTIEKAKEAHLVVSTLITTVAFAAAITVPGGYKSEDSGSDQGTPFLIRKAAFIAFVISDALAFIYSLAAVALNFQLPLPFFSINPRVPFSLATKYTMRAIQAIVLAFCTGTWAVLQPSPWLAVASSCIGLSFVYLTYVTI